MDLRFSSFLPVPGREFGAESAPSGAGRPASDLSDTSMVTKPSRSSLKPPSGSTYSSRSAAVTSASSMVSSAGSCVTRRTR